MQDYCVDKCNNVCKRPWLCPWHLINCSYYCKEYLCKESQIQIIGLFSRRRTFWFYCLWESFTTLTNCEEWHTSIMLNLCKFSFRLNSSKRKKGRKKGEGGVVMVWWVERKISESELCCIVKLEDVRCAPFPDFQF